MIKVGADPFPPYQYLKADGTLAGSDYERVCRLFQKIGCDICVTLDEWSEVQNKMEQGLLDAAFQVQFTPERGERFAFSNLFRYAETQMITARPDLTVDSYTEIPQRGLTLGLIEGYVNGDVIDSLPETVKRYYAGNLSLLQAIHAGEVDLGIFDKGVKEYLMEQHGMTGLFVIDAMTYQRPLHVIFNDPVLRDAFNTALVAEQEEK